MTAQLSGVLPTMTWRDWSCEVRLVVSDPDALEPAAEDLHKLMDRVNTAASRFRIDSDLCWANANAGRPTAISHTLVRLVDAALGEAGRSNGVVDPTLGRDLERLGYDRDIALVADSDQPVTPRVRRKDWRDVRLDRLAGLLTVPAGTALDLGASAKAYTADWAASQLAGRYGCSVLVEIGGDLATAGSRSWQVTVAERSGDPGQQVTMQVGGLATSTTTIRQWHRGGQRVHHILDPSTGLPANGPWRTVSVAAQTAVQANTCATAAIVLGEQALAWLAGQQVAARLVQDSGHVVTIGDWPC
jgi:thiamine biosynthesis lipoprotein